MRNNTVFTNTNNKPTASDELLKTTSLLYFREALRNQQYEQCAELIRSAKRFGARQSEIRKVIGEHFRRGRVGRQYEADERIGSRLRYLKEE